MDRNGEDVQPALLLRVVRQVGPWVVLAGVLLAALLIVTGFQGALRGARGAASGSGSIAASSSTDPTSTAVTGQIAVTRVSGVRLRFAADTRSDTLAIAKKGAHLQILSRTDKWLRVKDAAGHIGWIPNSSKSVQIRKK